MAGGETRYRDVLRHRDFRLLVAAFIVDQVGSWAYNVVLIVWVFDKTHSPAWIAATTASGWVPRALFSAYAGVLADRYERTAVMLVSPLLSFVAMIGVAVTVAADGPPAVALLLAATAGACASGYRPAAAAVIPEVVSERELVPANGIFGALEGLVVVLGPGIGGLFLLAGSAAAGITFNAMTFLAAALLVARLKVRSRGGAGSHDEPFRRQFADGIRALVTRPVVLVLVLFCCLDSMVYAASTVVYVPLSERLGTGSNGYSYLIAGFAVGGVAAAGLANRLSAAARLAPMILGGMLLLALPFALVAVVHEPVVAFLLQIVSGVGMVIVDMLAITALQRDLPGDVMSRVFGIFESAVPASLLVASFITATLLHMAGLTTTLLAIGFGFAGAAVLGLPPLLAADRTSTAAIRALQPRIAALVSLDLFAGASRITLEGLARAAHEVDVPADTVLIREGDEADVLWVLLAGSVAVSARGEARHARRLRTMEAGSYFGEIGLLRGLPRTATVRTLEPCSLLRIEAADFLAAIQGSGISSSLLAQSTARLTRTHPRLSTTAALVVPPPG